MPSSPRLPASTRVRAGQHAALALSLIVSVPTIFAQSTTTPSRPDAENETRDEVVTLSPFEVSTKGDTGYTVTSSLAGGRVNTELKNSPNVINILGAEFLKDIASTDILDAAQFALNVQTADPAVGTNNGQPSFRGLGASYTTRNYFRWYLPGDRYNTDRIEFSLGPNAMLFGDSNIGGVANTVTKKAIFRNFNEVSTSVNSDGGLRATFDANRALGSKVAVRVAGLVSRLPSWQSSFIKDDRESIYLTGTWRASKNTEFRFDAEGGKLKRNFPAAFYVDQVSAWDRTTVYNAASAATPATSTGLKRLNTNAANDYLVYDVNNVAQGVINLKNFATTSGTGLTLQPGDRSELGIANFPSYPGAHFQVGPGSTRLDQDYYAVDAYVTQRFGNNLIVEAAGSLQRNNADNNTGNWNTMLIDVNKVLPNGSTNPHFGQIYSEVAPQWNDRLNIAPQARLSATYLLDQVKWSRQRFSVILEHREEIQSTNTRVLGRVNGTNPDARNATNQVRQRVYWNDGGGWNATAIPFSSNGVELGWIRSTGQKNHQRLQNILLANQGSYLHNKLHTTLGVRRDHFERTQQVAGGNNSNGSVFFKDGEAKNVWVNSASYGAVWFPFSWLGFFANHSESFNPNTSTVVLTLEGDAPPVVRGKGLDLGLKIEFFDGRVSGTVSYYETRQLNNATSYSTTDINNIWTALGRTENLLDGANYVDTSDTLGQGWELALTANPTPAWRVLLNVAFPKTSQLNGAALLRAYYARNIDAWRAGAAAGGANGTLIATGVSNIERTLGSTSDGRANDDTYDYTANVFTTYAFREGRANGLRFGAGANLRGRSIQGNVPGAPLDYLYAPSYAIVRGLIGYEWKTRGCKWSAQLNVTNVLNTDVLRLNSFTTYQGVSVPQNYGNIAERQATLEVTAKF